MYTADVILILVYPFPLKTLEHMTDFYSLSTICIMQLEATVFETSKGN